MAVKIYGTLGPSCDDTGVLKDMFAAGMTGIRINLSHVMLLDCKDSISRIRVAAKECAAEPDILIDMQGPELRIGAFPESMTLTAGEKSYIGSRGIPLDKEIFERLECGDEILLDDGRILVKVTGSGSDFAEIEIIRGGMLTSRKSIRIIGKEISLPAISPTDLENLRYARELGVTGLMQPFIRSRDDLIAVREALAKSGCDELKVFAKIENLEGLNNLESYMDACDEIVIARGDLGNSMPLWELPRVQKNISETCNSNQMPFMVVTQMLSSMEKSEVPTRAEVSDIFNAVADGASSVMVTGETAVGEHPVEVIRYLANTAEEAVRYSRNK